MKRETSTTLPLLAVRVFCPRAITLKVHLCCLPLNNIVWDSVPRAAPRDRELRLPTGIHSRYGVNKSFASCSSVSSTGAGAFSHSKPLLT